MRAVVQRVAESSVRIGDRTVAKIGGGLLVLLAVSRRDERGDGDYLAQKISNLRIFEDETGRLNRSLLETGQEMLVVSQFTLYGDCRKGRRPSFGDAADPEKADRLYRYFVDRVAELGVRVKTGRFRETMAVSLVNDGPVTLIVDSP
jgi:D-aminoacyl-tRNA deacylase